jgi:hypothetical protein
VRLSARAINKAESVAVFAALLGSVVILQVLAGAYASGFGGYPDELIGRWAGLLPAVLFIASPLVQESSTCVMVEHLVTLGMRAGTLCFARFIRTGQIGDTIASGTVAAAAILAHGNAWALGLVSGLILALTADGTSSNGLRSGPPLFRSCYLCPLVRFRAD